MSATGDHETEEYVKSCLRFKLKKAEQQGFRFTSTDELVDYLLGHAGLDDTCKEWIRRAPNQELRELLSDHQTRLGRLQSSVAQAPFLNMGNMSGPSVPHRGNVSDSGYGPSPACAMDDLRMDSLVSSNDS